MATYSQERRRVPAMRGTSRARSWLRVHVEERLKGVERTTGRMDTDRIIEAAPHYVAILIIAYLVLFLIENVVGRLNFWLELLIILVIVFVYRFITIRLGIAPSIWEP